MTWIHLPRRKIIFSDAVNYIRTRDKPRGIYRGVKFFLQPKRKSRYASSAWEWEKRNELQRSWVMTFSRAYLIYLNNWCCQLIIITRLKYKILCFCRRIKNPSLIINKIKKTFVNPVQFTFTRRKCLFNLI